MPKSSRHPTNPFPHVISDRVWGLLFDWSEWRSVKGCPRSPGLPEATFRWQFQRGGLVGEPGFCMTPSTKSPEPGPIQVFGQAFGDLEELDQACILAVVEMQSEPWLKGERWQRWFRFLRVKRREYVRLLESALRNLNRTAKARGLSR